MNRPDFPANHPQNVPVDKWPDGWLKMECASRLGEPLFIIMHDYEKLEKGYPVTRDEMTAHLGTS